MLSQRMTKNGVDFSKRMDSMSPAFAAGYAEGWGVKTRPHGSMGGFTFHS
jgi:hypothetical protein